MAAHHLFPHAAGHGVEPLESGDESLQIGTFKRVGLQQSLFPPQADAVIDKALGNFRALRLRELSP